MDAKSYQRPRIIALDTSEGRFFNFLPSEKLSELKKYAEIKPFSKKEEFPDCDIIIMGHLKTDADFVNRIMNDAGRLKAIAVLSPATGGEGLDLDMATGRGVAVVHAPAPEDLAVFAIGLMIALSRRIVESHNFMKQGLWVTDEGELGMTRKKFLSDGLYGKVLGVIGLGQIGYRVAEIAKALGMKVLIHTRTIVPERIRKVGEAVDLKTLLKNSDYVSISVPLTSKTRGMIGREHIGLLKKNAYLINIARAAIIDQQALYEALRDRKIAGAAFDVFDPEPPPTDDPLLKLPNVVFTPHIAGATRDRYSQQAMIVAEDVLRILKGELPKSVANPKVLASPNRLFPGIKS